MTSPISPTSPTRFTVSDLAVEVHATPAELGAAAARLTADTLRTAVRERGHARVVLATGNSQFPFVEALRSQAVPWSSVTVFHMDEYVGVGPDHPASFRRWIAERIEEQFRPAVVHYIDGRPGGSIESAAIEAECERYEGLLRAAPIDLVCMGVGENCHLAFNEPYDADFEDPRWVRTFTLDDKTRRQQVGEGHFAEVSDVPATAISLTVPALLSAGVIQVCVPEARKAEAVRHTLTSPISTAHPSTVLRSRGNATLYLDRDSAGSLDLEAFTASGV
ncbi:MAG TPA: glucosamine-6-phosphate deaminase [Actinopolymorphaceae bacterium]